jgi:hypothetical protein
MQDDRDHDGPRPIGHFIPEVLARRGIDPQAVRRESRAAVGGMLEPAASGFPHAWELLAMG